MPHHSIRFILGLFLIFAVSSAPSAEDITLRSGGLELNGRLEMADGKTMADGAILMVHGTLAHNGMETIQGLQDVLAEREINTLAITLSLGISDRKGMYDCAKTHRHRHTDALDEIALWLNWLKAKGAKDVTLFGHSRGGNQAAWFAAERQHDLLRRLALLAPATWSAERVETGFKNNHGRDLAVVIEEAQALAAQGKGDQPMKGAGVLYCPGADVTPNSFLSYYLPDDRFDSPSLLEKIKHPVIVIAGGRDTVVAGLAERVEPMADGKNLRFALIEDADHFFLDLMAEDVADAIEELLAPEGT